ncbi:MAG: hypothetical protein HP491_03700 [Nitrospira sp.]|nr:hypothetical protein [Nitrospira sp.]MBH0180945.1 hypothetical protein [Nitrospira sp.]MBH0185561.1 hypothetical protein [Nitrospira sp.]
MSPLALKDKEVKSIQCAHCGAHNRVSGYSLTHTTVCGKCRKPLPEPSYIRSAKIFANYNFWIILAAIIGAAVVLNEFRLLYGPTSSNVQSNNQGHSPSSPVPIDYPAMPVTQGLHQLYTSAAQIAPFRIVTPSGTDNFYVKLTDASTGVLVMTFFIQGGQSFEAVVPVGTYRVKYATGTTWYGVDFVFGSATRYGEAVKVLEFSMKNNQISGSTIELPPQGGSSSHTKTISAHQFNCNILRNPTVPDAAPSTCP